MIGALLILLSGNAFADKSEPAPPAAHQEQISYDRLRLGFIA